MDLGRIVGNVVSVAKIEVLKPVRLFLVNLLDADFMPGKDFVVAIDTVGAGFGDYVIITTGSGARFTDISKPTHTDASIVARIDHFETGEKTN